MILGFTILDFKRIQNMFTCESSKKEKITQKRVQWLTLVDAVKQNNQVEFFRLLTLDEWSKSQALCTLYFNKTA